MTRIALLISASLLSSAPVLAQTIEPGMWETTSTVTGMEMPGMPPAMAAAAIGQVTTVSQCVTAEQIAEGPEALFAQSDGQCQFSEFTLEGGRMSMTGTCSAPGGQGVLTMHTEGTYTATTYEADATISMPMGAGRMTAQSAGAGWRVGDCG